jgi:hypothetical protein
MALLSGEHPLALIERDRPAASQIPIQAGPTVVAAAVRMDHRPLTPPLSVAIAFSSMVFAIAWPGCFESVHETTLPSWQSMTGGQVRLAAVQPELGHVGQPQAVRRIGVEVSAHEVFGRLGDLAPVRTVPPAPFDIYGDETYLLVLCSSYRY